MYAMAWKGIKYWCIKNKVYLISCPSLIVSKVHQRSARVLTCMSIIESSCVLDWSPSWRRGYSLFKILLNGHVLGFRCSNNFLLEYHLGLNAQLNVNVEKDGLKSCCKLSIRQPVTQSCNQRIMIGLTRI